MPDNTNGPLYDGDPKYKRLPDPGLTISETYALLNVSAIPADSSHPLVIAARGKLDDALAQQDQESSGVGADRKKLLKLVEELEARRSFGLGVTQRDQEAIVARQTEQIDWLRDFANRLPATQQQEVDGEGVVEIHTVERGGWNDDGPTRVLPSRVVDHSWRQHTAEPGCPYPPGPPPEWVDAMNGLHTAVAKALAADWTPKDIETEARQVAASYESGSPAETPATSPSEQGGEAYETSDYVEIREEDGGYHIYVRGYVGSRNWRSDGVRFTNRADAEAVARLTAKACYAEDLRTRGDGEVAE